MSGSNADQLRLIADMQAAFDAAGLSWWLFGGWGLDAQLGRITRDHGDFECWIARPDADAACQALQSIAVELLDTQPAEESRSFRRDGVTGSIAFFDRNDDGSFGVQGRWSDWVFPVGSFGATRGNLDGLDVPTMSVAGMLAMKQQYATLRNGAPLRDKDVGDIVALQGMIPRSEPHGS